MLRPWIAKDVPDFGGLRVGPGACGDVAILSSFAMTRRERALSIVRIAYNEHGSK